MNNRNKHSDPDSQLYSAILKLQTVEECYDFFTDLCTFSELKAMEQRFELAKLLNDGLIYNDILEKTGASSATISRVNRSLNYGMGAYRIIFDRMKEDEQKQKEQQDAINADRAGQVGTGDRSEKIRTYNFPQDRCTDHRIGLTVHNLDKIMDGNLDDIIDALATREQAEKLQKLNT